MFVILDDGGELAEAPAGMTFETVIRKGRYVGISVIAAFETSSMRSFAGWIRELRKDSHGFLLQPDLDLDGDLFGVRLPRALPAANTSGRGFYAVRGVAELCQSAAAEGSGVPEANGKHY